MRKQPEGLLRGTKKTTEGPNGNGTETGEGPNRGTKPWDQIVFAVNYNENELEIEPFNPPNSSAQHIVEKIRPPQFVPSIWPLFQVLGPSRLVPWTKQFGPLDQTIWSLFSFKVVPWTKISGPLDQNKWSLFIFKVVPFLF